MRPLHLRLLGPPKVCYDGQPLKLRTKKALALLAYLTAEGGSHSRETLAALLWPESLHKRGRTTLRRTLADLRKSLPESVFNGKSLRILTENDSLRLEIGSDVELDIRILEVASETAQAIARNDVSEILRSEAVEKLQAATQAYRGEFLQGLSLNAAPEFDYWLDLEREAWRQRAALIFDYLSQLQIDGGEPSEAVKTATTWAKYDRLSETAQRRLIEARFAAGDEEGALQVYDVFRSVLEQALGTGPGPETEALAARIRKEAGPRSSSRLKPRARGSLKETFETPLVGRVPEFSALIADYYAASNGEPRVVTLVGETGIGKTRLAMEFLLWARSQGADVLEGRAFGSGGQLPYQPLVDAFRRRIDRERAPDDLLSDVWMSELSRLLPELRERYPDLPPPASDEVTAHLQLYEAIARLVSSLAKPTPVVLFIDDLHWADTASLNVLRYVGRRWTEDARPILLILNVRSEELNSSAELSSWLSYLSRDLSVSRLNLSHLTLEDTVRLLEALAGPGRKGGDTTSQEPQVTDTRSTLAERGQELERFGRWLFAETGGQPLFLVETLKVLLERGVLTRPLGAEEWSLNTQALALENEALRLEALPGVREVISSRLSRLSGAATELLAAAAVLGCDFDFGTLRRVADLSETEALSAMDEALGNLLLVRTKHEKRYLGKTVYGFGHDKVRLAVYAEVCEARREVLHQRALAFLEAAAAHPAELAHHALTAGLEEAAFRHSLAAGDEAMAVFAVRDAIGHYERARRLLAAAGKR